MEKELDLRQLLFTLLKRWKLIVAGALLAAALSFLYSSFIVVPKYSSTASLYVYNASNRSSSDITTSDLTTSQKLVQTYIVILTSDAVLDDVSARLDGKYTSDQIREMMSLSAINDTEAFRITVTCVDRADAQQIVNTIVDIAPQKIIQVVKAGSVETIDRGKLPTEPSSPNIRRNVVTGAFIGLFLVLLYVLAGTFLSNVVHTEEELVKTLDIPMLGVIPRMYDEDERGGGKDA